VRDFDLACRRAAQLGKRFKRGAEVEDSPEYARASHLLTSLGLQKYQGNLKRGMLNDATLMLWTDRFARDAQLYNAHPACPCTCTPVVRWRQAHTPVSCICM
jgi:hypothetical protein